MSIIPQDVPTGAIRYNTDSNKMECFDGTKWWQVAVSESAPSAGRGVQVGDEAPSPSVTMEYISMEIPGNAIDFGDLQTGVGACAAAASRTRGLAFGGVTTYPGTFTNTIDYITIATRGNGQNFGDLATTRRAPMSFGDATRGGVAGGASPSYTASQTGIDYVTITTQGNTQDFGDISAATSLNGSSQMGSRTRGLLMSNNSNGPATVNNTVEYITVQSTGDAIDFGDTINAVANCLTAGNSVRGMVAGGSDPSLCNTMQYCTISTTGNFIDFGDLNMTTREASGFSSPIRAVWTDTVTVTMSSTIIATTGTAIDFGDFLEAKNHNSALTNCHGGL